MGKLSILATPIGNLEDITLRALRALRECDAIFCEDTRVTAKLLAHYGFRKPLYRCDERMELRAAERVIAMLGEGKHVVLVSDAGTPGISDPGARLVARAREAGAHTEAIPGPSALTAALSIAGIHASEFLFLGFLPHKKGRQTALQRIVASDIPVVLFESPYRILALLQALKDSRVIVVRELTKIHEEVTEGSGAEVAASLKKRGAVRGEFVVIVSPEASP